MTTYAQINAILRDAVYDQADGRSISETMLAAAERMATADEDLLTALAAVLDLDEPGSTITLDNGQFNLLVSTLGFAQSTIGHGNEYIGYPDEIGVLSDQVRAQGAGSEPGTAGHNASLRLQARGLRNDRSYSQKEIRDAA